MQKPEGQSLYLRLSTRSIEQPQRELDAALEADIVAGGYWLRPPGAAAELAICVSGAVTPEALAAHAALAEDLPGLGLLVVTSPDRLYADWRRARQAGGTSHAARLLGALPSAAALVTVVDAHPATLSWLGAVRGHRVQPLGVDRFGQSGDIPDLYHHYGLDAEAIVAAAARLSLEALGR
jgi:pyruvate dehydrogenase E1 component